MSIGRTAARPRSRPGGGGVAIRRALALAGCGVLSVGLAGCESTEQESSKIAAESVAATPSSATPPKGAHHARRGGHAHSASHAPRAKRAPAQ
jgi:hypothetical protein